MLQDVVHGDDVVPADMVGQIGRLECPLQHVVAALASLGRDVRLDLDARAFQVKEPAELVEMTAVTRAHVEEATGRVVDQPSVVASS